MKGGGKRGLIIFGVIFVIIVVMIIIFFVDPFDWRCQKKTESCKDVEDCCGKELKCIDKKCSKPEPPEPPEPPGPPGPEPPEPPTPPTPPGPPTPPTPPTPPGPPTPPAVCNGRELPNGDIVCLPTTNCSVRTTKISCEMSNYKNDHTTNKCVWENDTCNIGEECNKCLGEWFN